MGVAVVVMTGSSPAVYQSRTTRPYEVVMAICNGRSFLLEQLETLGQQTAPPSRLVVVDDASNDESADLVEEWAAANNMPLCLLRHPQRQGSTASFAQALELSEADYVFLCDQDDLWDRDKAERLLQRMAELERVHGRSVPLLVHSDLRLVDANGALQALSFHRYQCLNPKCDRWLELAMQNVVTGCATLVNRSCVQAACPFPNEAVLHDWWLALVASGLGTVSYVASPTLSYRQHGRNLVGASGFWSQITRRISQGLRGGNPGELIAPGVAQLNTLWQRFGCRLKPPLNERQCQCVIALSSRSPCRRLCAAVRLKLHKHGGFRTLAFYLCLVLWRPASS